MKQTMYRWAAFALAGLSAVSASAQNWPTKPITFIVPYAAGGGADSRSRQITQFLSRELGQPIIVENKAGAGGNIGTEFIARGAPDGYTMGMGNFAPLAVNQALFAKLNYDPQKDLIPVALVDKGPLLLTVLPSNKYRSVRDVIAAAKATPDKLSFGSGGIGGSHHLSGELFKQSAKIELVHIPYKSGAAATTDLLGGSVDMMFEQMYSAMPNVKAGKLLALAITSAKRSPLLPDVPTMGEAGAPGVEVLNWQGIVVPKGTPPAIVNRLNAAVNKALADPTIHEQILSQGNEVGGGSPADFAKFVASESAKWTKVVRTANIKPE